MNSFFILNNVGQPLILRHFRGNETRTPIQKFWETLQQEGQEQRDSPVLAINRWYFIHIVHNSVYFVCEIQKDTNPLQMLTFLQSFVKALGHYSTKINEETILNKQTFIYQILAEMLEYGFPFTTEPNMLAELVNKPAPVGEMLQSITEGMSATLGNLTGFGNVSSADGMIDSTVGKGSHIPTAMPSSLYWRKNDVRYAVNEIFLDAAEEIDAIVDCGGRIIKGHINGKIIANSKLSGIPDLTLRFGNPRMLEDVSFHPCVRYLKWKHNKVVSFIPPDGIFELMSYRIQLMSAEVPIWIKPHITYAEGNARVNIQCGCKGRVSGSAKTTIETIRLTIPFSKHVNGSNVTSANGTVHFDHHTNICTWTLTKPATTDTFSLSGTLSMTAGSPLPSANPIIQVAFKMNAYACSGLRIDNLDIHGNPYKPYKGIKFITRAGSFVVRS